MIRPGRALWVVLLTVALGAPATAAMAQVTTGIVSGTVQDPQGGVIPGATVVLISETRDTRSTPVVTSGDGAYSFPNVAPDRYIVEVSMSGFRPPAGAGSLSVPVIAWPSRPC